MKKNNLLNDNIQNSTKNYIKQIENQINILDNLGYNISNSNAYKDIDNETKLRALDSLERLLSQLEEVRFDLINRRSS